jgi:phosphoglycolate phosphatase
MKFNTILFDLDGTLVDSLADIHQAVNHVLTEFDRPPLELDTVKNYIGDGVRVLVARSFLGWDEEELSNEGPDLTGYTSEMQEKHEEERQVAIMNLLERARKIESPTPEVILDSFNRFYQEHLLDNTQCYVGIEETLEALESYGISMAVVSNKPENYSKKILSGLGIFRYFKAIVGGDTVQITKPSPDPVMHAMEKTKADPSCTLMLGDSVNDILSGKNAGCKTGIVTYGMGSSSTLRAYRPDVEIGDISELLALCTDFK